MTTKSGHRIRLRVDGDRIELTERRTGFDLPPKRQCWETVTFDQTPYEDPAFEDYAFVHQAVAFSGTHWYLRGWGNDGLMQIWRWEYPSFTNPELVFVYPENQDETWEDLGLTYLDGHLWWAVYHDGSEPHGADDRNRTAGCSVTGTLPATEIVLHDHYFDYPAELEGAEVNGIVGVPTSHRLFGLGYISDPNGDRLASRIVEYFPNAPGTHAVRWEVSDTINGCVISEWPQATPDGLGKVWFATWPVGGHHGRLCRFDPTTYQVVQTEFPVTTGYATIFVGRKEGGLLYVEDQPSGVFIVDNNFQRRRVGCLEGFPPGSNYEDGEAGAHSDTVHNVTSPDFSETVWVLHEDDGLPGMVRHLIPKDTANVESGNNMSQAGDVSAWATLNVSGLNGSATLELGEPTVSGARNDSIWWKWTSPGDLEVIADTRTSESDVYLRVFTGTSVSALTLVATGTADQAFSGEYTMSLEFTATPGTTYYFQLLGKSDSP